MDVTAIANVAFTSEDRVRDVICNFNADGSGEIAEYNHQMRVASDEQFFVNNVRTIALSQ
jgi:hypothetical protein